MPPKKKADTAVATAPPPAANTPLPVAATVVAPTQPVVAPMIGMPMPGMPGMQPNQQNPMLAMMSMLQMMQSGVTQMLVDPASIPFAAPVAPVAPEADKGLEAGIIRTARLTDRVKHQEAVKLGSILDYLCLTSDGKNALGGIPKGCTIAFAGPPGTSKTRTMLAALANVARTGEKVAFVVAEEGFHDTKTGRDDLCSRLIKIGMAVTGLDEAKFEKEVLERLYVVEAQYHTTGARPGTTSSRSIAT